MSHEWSLMIAVYILVISAVWLSITNQHWLSKHEHPSSTAAQTEQFKGQAELREAVFTCYRAWATFTGLPKVADCQLTHWSVDLSGAWCWDWLLRRVKYMLNTNCSLDDWHNRPWSFHVSIHPREVSLLNGASLNRQTPESVQNRPFLMMNHIHQLFIHSSTDWVHQSIIPSTSNRHQFEGPTWETFSKFNQFWLM